MPLLGACARHRHRTVCCLGSDLENVVPASPAAGASIPLRRRGTGLRVGGLAAPVKGQVPTGTDVRGRCMNPASLSPSGHLQTTSTSLSQQEEPQATGYPLAFPCLVSPHFRLPGLTPHAVDLLPGFCLRSVSGDLWCPLPPSHSRARGGNGNHCKLGMITATALVVPLDFLSICTWWCVGWCVGWLFLD